jgi:hypothetical protein
MKNIFYLVLIVFCTSCEKEITLDLEPTQSKYVIEAVITNDINIQTVKINKSVNFYDSNNYPAVSNAIVKVTENGNPPITFTEVSPGIYQANNFIGVPGRSYSLSIIIDNLEYFATSTMPLTVPFTEITFEENAFNPPGQETNYVVTPLFSDPSIIQNFYRFNLTVNNIKDKGFFTLNDDLINGEENSFGLSSTDEDNTIKMGSQVTIEMIGIDKNVYNYFYVLEQNSDSQNTPNNPKTNISRNVLGYFSAQNMQVRTITIQ